MGLFKKKKTIYTACFGDYDKREGDSADVYFNEENNPFDVNAKHLSPRLMAKMYKVLNPLSHDIWIDASIKILDRKGLEKLLGGDFTLFTHPFNKSVKEELDLCHEIGYVNDVHKQKIVDLYKSANMDIEKTPLYAAGVLYRTKKADSFNRLWWSLICQYSYRDQLTLPYAIAQSPELKVKVLDLDIFNNDYLKVSKHEKEQDRV
jgi:hypothetical protein